MKVAKSESSLIAWINWEMYFKIKVIIARVSESPSDGTHLPEN